MVSASAAILFDKLEAAIDVHPRLERLNRENPLVSEPFLRIYRHSVTACACVKLTGRRKKPFQISNQGDTAQEAIDNLIACLDYWADVSADR